MKTKRQQVSKSSHIQPDALRMAMPLKVSLLLILPLQREERSGGHHLTTWLL